MNTLIPSPTTLVRVRVKGTVKEVPMNRATRRKPKVPKGAVVRQ